MDCKVSAVSGAEACAVRYVLDRMGDRWSMLALLTLHQAGQLRFLELKSRMLEVSQRMLTQTLRHLEREGLVSREAHVGLVPRRVDYALTALGQSFIVPLMEVVQWSASHQDDLRAARAEYDKSNPTGAREAGIPAAA